MSLMQAPDRRVRQRVSKKFLLCLAGVLVLVDVFLDIPGVSRHITPNIWMVVGLLIIVAIGFVVKYIKEKRDLASGKRQSQSAGERRVIMRRRKRIFTWVIGMAFVLVILLEASGFGGQIKFYAKWIECGRKPFKSGIVFKNTIHYVRSPTFSLLRLQPTYFCSEKEAELRGFSAQSTSPHYPHLTPEELKQQQAPRFDGE